MKPIAGQTDCSPSGDTASSYHPRNHLRRIDFAKIIDAESSLLTYLFCSAHKCTADNCRGPAFAAGSCHYIGFDRIDDELRIHLCRLTLAHEFGLVWWQLRGRLVPGVPGRLDYVHYVIDCALLAGQAKKSRDQNAQTKKALRECESRRKRRRLVGRTLEEGMFQPETTAAKSTSKGRGEVQDQSLARLKDLRHNCLSPVHQNFERKSSSSIYIGLAEGSEDAEKSPDRNALSITPTGASLDPNDIAFVDIGCGANAILSLLVARLTKCRVIATDIDEASLEHAQKLIETNGLSDRVTLCLQKDRLKGLVGINPGANADAALLKCPTFVILCNPPFFDTAEDEETKGGGTSEGAPAVRVRARSGGMAGHPCRGRQAAVDELSCAGGDLGFVLRLIEESVLISRSVRTAQQSGQADFWEGKDLWWSAWVGRKSTLLTLEAALRSKYACKNFASFESRPGNQMRWLLFWKM